MEKQCPLCGIADVIVLSLKEPLLSEVAPFCTLFSENFKSLIKVNRFKQDQIKLIIQRFNEIVCIVQSCYIFFIPLNFDYNALCICFKDKKYEALKMMVTKERQYLKILNQKNMNLKAEIEKLSKMLSETNNQQTFCAETSINSDDVSMYSANPK